MQKFRKKPVVIEAMRIMAYTQLLAAGEIADWVRQGGGTLVPRQQDPGPAYAEITTLEGVMRAKMGDWIIRGVKGEFYPCKSDIFEATYEPVVD